MNDVKKSNTTFKLSSRLLALFLTLAMIVGVVPTALAENGDTFYGNVVFKVDGANADTVDTSKEFFIYVDVAYGSTESTMPDARIYLDGDTSKYTLVGYNVGVTKSVDGLSYTLKEDSTGRYIQVDGITPGMAKTLVFKAFFNAETPDKTPLKVAVCNGTTEVVSNNNTPADDEITAKTKVDMSNSITANAASKSIDQNDTTLQEDITYTIKAAVVDNGSAQDEHRLGTGEAKVTKYTMTNEVTLPNGMYIPANSDIQSIYTIKDSNGNDVPYTVKETKKDSNGNITGFTVEYTRTPSTDDKTQMGPEEFTAVLKHDNLQTPTGSFNAGVIKNTVTTTYYTKEYDPTDPSTPKEVPHVTSPATANVTVSRGGNGIKSASKHINRFPSSVNANAWENSSRAVYESWNNAVKGYVIQGDLIEYTITVENDKGTAQTYTITDYLDDAHLEFVKLSDSNATTYAAEGSGEPIIRMTVPANGSKTLTFMARAKDDWEGTIVNKAKITLGDVSVDVEAEPVPQQTKKPELSINKTTAPITIMSAFYPDNGIYGELSHFYYVVEVKNTGTAQTGTINVTDSLPEGVLYLGDEGLELEYESTVVTQSEISQDITINNGTVSGTIDNLYPGEALRIRIPVKIDDDVAYSNGTPALSSITNKATAYIDENDPKDASVTIYPNTSGVSDIWIIKRADKETVAIGDTVTYRLELTNMGNGDITNTEFYVTDDLPEGLKLENTENITYNVATSNGHSGTVELINGGPEDNHLVFKVNAETLKKTTDAGITIYIPVKVLDTISTDGNIVNTAQIYSDPDLTHPGDSDTDSKVTPYDASAMPDLSVTKKAYHAGEDPMHPGAEILSNTESLQGGETVTFTVTITNETDKEISQFTLDDTVVGQLNVYASKFGQNTSVKLYDIDANSSFIKGEKQVWDNGNYTIEPEKYNIGDTIFETYSVDNSSVFHMEYTEKEESSSYTNNGSRNYTSNGLTLAPNGHITFIYSMHTDNVVKGSNAAEVLCNGKLSKSTVEFPDPSSSTVTVPSTLEMTKEAAPEGITIKSSDISTYAANNSIEDIYEAAEKYIKENVKYKYTITLRNTSDQEYNASGVTFTDLIPAGFGLYFNINNINYRDDGGNQIYTVDGYVNQNGWVHNGDIRSSVEADLITDTSTGAYTAIGSNAIDMQRSLDGYIVDGNPNQKYPVLEGKGIAFTFNEPIKLAARNEYDTIDRLFISYTLVPTQATIDAIIKEMKDNEGIAFVDKAFKNQITFKTGTPFNTTDGKTNQTTLKAVENVYLVSSKIHPGIEKTPETYFTPDGLTSHTYGVSSTRIQPGDSVSWKVTVWNKADASGGGDTISNFTVTDIYPESYTFDDRKTVTGSQGAVLYTAYIKKYDKNDNVIATSENSSLPYPTLTPGDKQGTFTFSGNEYALEPGQRLEFSVLTKYDAESAEYGLYTNKVALTVDGQTIYADAVVSGEKSSENELDESGQIPIYPISTLGKKYVKRSSDAEYTVDSSKNTLERRIKTEPDDYITYKLEVVNNEAEHVLEDFAIIDRLAYEGDTGVISPGGRGSNVEIKYKENQTPVVKIKLKNSDEFITLDPKYLKVDFSNDVSHVFESTDIDWSPKVNKGEVVWHQDSSDESITLVRFALVNLDQYAGEGENNPFLSRTVTELDKNGNEVQVGKYGVPEGATITIEFEAKIPTLVEHTGDNYTGWNSFAYYFNSESHENMVAEPTKVGAWVEDTSFGGNILVRKKFKSNVPNDSRTFYFAIYDRPYDKNDPPTALDKRSLTLKGSSGYTQKEIYFTNLDINPDGTNKSYYIYETDSNYEPLEAISKETGTGDYANHNVSKTASYNGFTFTMDNKAQVDAEKLKNGDIDDKKEALYEGDYLVWQKDLSQTKTLNSAVFVNEYEAKIEPKVMGPFYADVATEQEDADENKNANGGRDMLSSRPGADYEFGDDLPEQATTDRANKKSEAYGSYGNGTTYGTTVRFGKDQDHTIATGFLAELTGIGDYTINKVTWDITFNDSEYKDKDNNIKQRSADSVDPGVFVRLRSGSGTGNESEEEVQFFNLTEYMAEMGVNPAEVKAESIGNIEKENDSSAVMNNEDEISFDEADETEGVLGDIFFSPYTKEEGEEIFAAEIGLDPANMVRDEFGNALFAVKGTGEVMNAENASNALNNAALTETGFTDATDNEGYTIWKLNGTTKYNMHLVDAFPHITLSKDSTVYIGMIIDQLYDRHASAEITLSDQPEYEDDTVQNAAGFIAEKHTLLDKQDGPIQTGGFTAGKVVYKLDSDAIVKFDEVDAAKYEDSVVDENFTVTAATGKAVTFKKSNKTFADGNSFTSLVSLGGQGPKDCSYRTVIVNAEAGQKLQIFAVSGSDETDTTTGKSKRTLMVKYQDDNGNWVEETLYPALKSASSPAVCVMSNNITTSGPVYIYSNNSSIDIYGIGVQ